MPEPPVASLCGTGGCALPRKKVHFSAFIKEGIAILKGGT